MSLDLWKEGVFVALKLTLLYFLIHSVAMSLYKERSMMDHRYVAAQVFLCGLLYHVLSNRGR